MSSNDKQTASENKYCTPSLFADLFATFVGLALVYGMIALVGNANSGGASEAKAGVQTNVRQLPTYDLSVLKAKAKGEMAAFLVHKVPKKVPAFVYVDERDAAHSLAELQGKVVLLNLWATWCGPCRHEMPWLDRLQKKYGGKGFEMLTISIDRGGFAKPRRFFDQIKVKNLTLYNDKTGRLAPTLRAFGMPTTLLIDRYGQELGRMAGPAQWDSKDAHDFIETAMGLGERSNERAAK